jgi:MFS-type transporter involved in bile tolerance (Atg22 family)
MIYNHLCFQVNTVILSLTNNSSNADLQNISNPLLDADGSECTVVPTQSPVLPNSVTFTKPASNMTTNWDKTTYSYPDLQPSNVHCGDDFWYAGCTVNYCTKEHSATEKAGKVMSIPYLISSVSSPLLGHMVDKVGRRAVIATIASTILLVVHLSLALLVCSPVIPMVGQGIAYSLYAAVLWPSVPLTVSKQYIGTAFGVITCIQNIGLALFPLIIAAIYNTSGNNYIPNVEFFFASCAAAGVIIGILMIQVDRKTGGRLGAISSTGNEEGDIRRNGDFEPLNDEMDGHPIS